MANSGGNSDFYVPKLTMPAVAPPSILSIPRDVDPTEMLYANRIIFLGSQVRDAAQLRGP